MSPRKNTPADVVDLLDARLALSNALEVVAVQYDPPALLVQDETGQRFYVSVKVAK